MRIGIHRELDRSEAIAVIHGFVIGNHRWLIRIMIIYIHRNMFTWLSFTSRRVSSLNFFGISTINNVPLCFGPYRP